MSKYVEIERDGNVAVLNYVEGKRNVLNTDGLAALQQAFASLEDDAEIDGIVVTGKNGWLAGADIKELAGFESADEIGAHIRKGHALMRFIRGMKTRTVGAITKGAFGGGFELLTACDARIIGPETKVGLPEATLGVLPGWGGVAGLLRIAGFKTTADFVRQGKIVVGNAACSLGWAMTTADDPIEAAKILVGSGDIPAPFDGGPVANIPDDGLDLAPDGFSRSTDRVIVKTLFAAARGSYDEGLEAEAKAFEELFGTHDMKEGLTAFAEKRKPEWKHE